MPRHFTASPFGPILELIEREPLLMQRLSETLRDADKGDHPLLAMLNDPEKRREAGERLNWRGLSAALSIPLSDLAEGLGLDMREARSHAAESMPADFQAGELEDKEVTEFDARPLLKKGVEPFLTIKKKLLKISSAESLKLIVDFEPVPLYLYARSWGLRILAQKNGGVYEIYFIQREERQGLQRVDMGFVDVERSLLEAAEGRLKKELPAAFQHLDVSALPAPEPAEKIVNAVAKNENLLMLKVTHRKRPDFLSPLVERFGFVAAPFLDEGDPEGPKEIPKEGPKKIPESWTIYLFFKELPLNDSQPQSPHDGNP